MVLLVVILLKIFSNVVLLTFAFFLVVVDLLHSLMSACLLLIMEDLHGYVVI